MTAKIVGQKRFSEFQCNVICVGVKDNGNMFLDVLVRMIQWDHFHARDDEIKCMDRVPFMDLNCQRFSDIRNSKKFDIIP